MKIALDSNVIIAALLSWHERHEACAEALNAALGSGDQLVVPVPSLFESYSVMTRLPEPHRVSAEDALTLLTDPLVRRSEIVGLTGQEAWEVVTRLGSDAVTGGRVYDAHILACAQKADAEKILTLNTKHFDGFAVGSVQVTVP